MISKKDRKRGYSRTKTDESATSALNCCRAHFNILFTISSISSSSTTYESELLLRQTLSIPAIKSRLHFNNSCFETAVSVSMISADAHFNRSCFELSSGDTLLGNFRKLLLHGNQNFIVHTNTHYYTQTKQQCNKTQK